MIRSLVHRLVCRLLFGPPPKALRGPVEGVRLHPERLAVDGGGVKATRKLAR